MITTPRRTCYETLEARTVLRPFRMAIGCIALFLLTSCIGSSLPKTPKAGGPAWQEITTEHFVVDTDLAPDDAALIVRQLENLRKVMIEVVFGGEPEPTPRMRVLALRQDEYAHFDR